MMNMTALNKNRCFDLNHYLSAFKIEPALYKFFSIMKAVDQVKEACREERLVKWLKSDEWNLPPNRMQEYQDVVFTALGLTYHSGLDAYKKRTEIAKTYAGILNQYSPDNKGDLNQTFNFYELVLLIRDVFESHISNDEDLFRGGLEINLERRSFFAKVEAVKIYLFDSQFELIGHGAYGKVGCIYEIASQKLLAFKFAYNDQKKITRICREISALKYLHRVADFDEFSVLGLQEKPLVTVHLPDFSGFAGSILGGNLLAWCEEDHSNEDRIHMCQSIMKAFTDVHESKFWHGDIKLDNILESQNGVVFIDWDGAICLPRTSSVKRPRAVTPRFISLEDLKNLESLEDEWEVSGMTDDLKRRYEEVASSIDLFAVAIVLFCVLTSYEPFEIEWCENYQAELPLTNKGICSKGWNQLVEKKYDFRIVQVISKMLRWNPKDRFSFKEAVHAWKTI